MSWDRLGVPPAAAEHAATAGLDRPDLPGWVVSAQLRKLLINTEDARPAVRG